MFFMSSKVNHMENRILQKKKNDFIAKLIKLTDIVALSLNKRS